MTEFPNSITLAQNPEPGPFPVAVRRQMTHQNNLCSDSPLWLNSTTQPAVNGFIIDSIFLSLPRGSKTKRSGADVWRRMWSRVFAASSSGKQRLWCQSPFPVRDQSPRYQIDYADSQLLSIKQVRLLSTLHEHDHLDSALNVFTLCPGYRGCPWIDPILGFLLKGRNQESSTDHSLISPHSATWVWLGHAMCYRRPRCFTTDLGGGFWQFSTLTVNH